MIGLLHEFDENTIHRLEWNIVVLEIYTAIFK